MPQEFSHNSDIKKFNLAQANRLNKCNFEKVIEVRRIYDFFAFMTKHKPTDLTAFIVLFYDRIGFSHFTGSLNGLCAAINIDVKTAKSYIKDLTEIGMFNQWEKKGKTVFHCRSIKDAFTEILSLEKDSKYIRIYRPFGKKKGLNRTKSYQYENLNQAKQALKEAFLLHKIKNQNNHVQQAVKVQDAFNGTNISRDAVKALKKAYKNKNLDSLLKHRRDVVTGSRHIAKNILHTSKSDAHKTLKRLEEKGHFVLKPVLKSNCRKLTQTENVNLAKLELETINDELKGNFKVFLNKNTMKLNYFLGTLILFNY